MKKILLALILVAAGYQLGQHEGWFTDASTPSPPSVAADATSAATDSDLAVIANAYDRQQSNIQVRGQGVVQKILPDDNQGSRHQRFLVRLSSGQSLLIAHNIDLAPRIESLREADIIAFSGEYEWNNKGGVIHWTHRDPQGRHVGGWLEHHGRRYQ